MPTNENIRTITWLPVQFQQQKTEFVLLPVGPEEKL